MNESAVFYINSFLNLFGVTGFDVRTFSTAFHGVRL